MIKFEMKLYSFGELGEKAKQRAINEHLDFLLSVYDPEGYLLEDYANDMSEDSFGGVIDSIECNDYKFFKDGTLASVTEFCGKHSRAGEIEISIHGEIIVIK